MLTISEMVQDRGIVTMECQ